jgi:hypothetical protein
VIDPLFWLGLSILLVAVSLTAVLVAALPALQELARAARSAEKLFDTLRRELPPTLEAIRLTGLEISDLTDDVSEGVKSAGQVVKQVDQSLTGAKNQAKKAQVNTRGVVTGIKAAWKTWNRPSTGRKSVDRLPPSQRRTLELHESETSASMTSADNTYRELDTDLDDTNQKTPETFYKDIKDSLPQRQYEDVEQPDESLDY